MIFARLGKVQVTLRSTQVSDLTLLSPFAKKKCPLTSIGSGLKSPNRTHIKGEALTVVHDKPIAEVRVIRV